MTTTPVDRPAGRDALAPPAEAPAPRADGYRAFTTRDPAWIEAAQRMRYEVFRSDFDADIPAREPGLDADRFDGYCEHLVIVHEPSGEVAGTCRMLRPEAALAAGGRYSEEMFDLSQHTAIHPAQLEVSRLCVPPAHRNGTVVSGLWAGIVRYAESRGCRWLAGCCSVPLRDGGALAAATWDTIAARHLAPAALAVRPHAPWSPEGVARPGRTLPPPLLRGYLRLGARVCGEPAHDPDFRSADMYVLLDLDRTDRRYLSRYASFRAA